MGPPLAHQDEVLGVAFSPDGKWLLTGSADRTARLWDAATGRAVGPPLRHRGRVGAVRFAPDGRTILTASEQVVSLWSGPPNALFLGTLPVHGVTVYDLACSPDGKTVVTVGGWGLSRGLIHVCRLAQDLSHPAGVGAEAIPGSTWVLPVSVRPWFQLHRASYSPDATRLVAGGPDGCARLLDTATGLERAMQHGLPENGSPWGRLEMEVLRREAEALVKGRAADSKK